MSKTIKPGEYGRRGIVGIGVPQANPTVEQEAFALRPTSVSLVISRLTSCDANPQTRIAEYLEKTVQYAGQFDDLALDAFGIACTGSSYLLGAEAEASLTAEFTEELGYPVITAAEAITESLRKLGVQRISLVSPYPEWLAARAVEFWTAKGFEVAELRTVPLSGTNLHGIYQLRSGDALNIAVQLDYAACDAILFTGTGMPTLGAIAPLTKLSGHPVLSSNLCLMTALARQLGLTGEAVLPLPAGFDATAL